jgi:cytochrome P450
MALWERALHNPFDRKIRHHLGVPIMPGRYPFFGHLPAVRYALPDLLERAERLLGPMFWLESPTPKGKVLDLVHLDESVFHVLRSKSVDSSVLREGAEELLGDSMIVRDGAPHRHTRSAFNAPFTPTGLTSTGVGSLFAHIVEKRLAEWVRPGPFRVVEKTQELTLELIFRLLDQPPDDLARWRKAYQDLLLIVIALPLEFPGSPKSRAVRAREWLNQRILEAMERARRESPEASFMSSLLGARDEDGRPLEDAELVENLRLLLLAGHETSATAMAWMLVHLGRDRELYRRLVAEALGAGKLPDSARTLKNFPFAEALFRESVRLYTPAPLISRVLTEEAEIGGRRFPRGIRITFPLVHLARDSRRYSDPHAFRPDRWLERTAPPSAFETLPFGGGAHFCLGYHTAWMESVQFAIAVALSAHRQKLRPHHEGPLPRSVWFPLAAPVSSTEIRFEPDAI